MKVDYGAKTNREVTEGLIMAYEKSLDKLNLNTSGDHSDFRLAGCNETTSADIDIGGSMNLTSIYCDNVDLVSEIRYPLADSKNYQSLIDFKPCLGIIERKFDTKKKIIYSILAILRDHAADIFNSSAEHKHMEYFYDLFQECISNFIADGFESQVVDSLIDILLPNSDMFSEFRLEHDSDDFRIIPSILYYYLIGMTQTNTFLFERVLFNLDSGDNVGSFLLPTSRAISEVNYAWLNENSLEQARDAACINRGSKQDCVKTTVRIFTEEHIPNLIDKIIKHLTDIHLFTMVQVKRESFKENFYKDNIFNCVFDQTPFFIGRILEICHSKSRKEFISMFLQLDGPLVIVPYLFYSSMQDFFLRFFGLIGNNYRREYKHSDLSNSILDLEYPERNNEGSVGDLGPNKSLNLDECLDVGIPSIILEWTKESGFIQNLIYPLSNIMYDCKEDLIKESSFIMFDAIHAASGVMEVIFRLVEYLRPEHTGLPLNMTSVGLKWFMLISELRDQNSVCRRDDEAIHGLYLSNIEECRIYNSEEKFIKIEYDIMDILQLRNSNKKINGQNLDRHKDVEFENLGIKINSDMCNGAGFSRRGHIDHCTAQLEKYFTLLSEDGNTIKNFSAYQCLERSRLFLNNLIVESSILNLLCEIIVYIPSTTIDQGLYMLKLRSMSVLEEVINLAFSPNVNIIDCLKLEIFYKVQSYLNKFCEFVVLRYDASVVKGETGYLVSLLTIIKIILLYDESHDLINGLNVKFWAWLLNLFIKGRENSHISVHCKKIFELSFQFGSLSTLENLFNVVKLIERLSKFIYDGTDLEGNSAEENEHSNKKIGKKKRIFGSIKNLLMLLGRYQDELLNKLLNYNSEYFEVIKEVIKHMVVSQWSKFSNVSDSTVEIISSTIEHELKTVNLPQNGEQRGFKCSTDIDSKKIIILLTNLSCGTKFHRFMRTHGGSNKARIPLSSFSMIDNMENSSKSPNYTKDEYLYRVDSSNLCEADIFNTQALSGILRMYLSGNFASLFKCDENCECPKWSFCNVLKSLLAEKNHSSGISVFPIIPLEESRKIRETRKRQMKLYSVQKND
ncbi:hypothetical protein OJ253_3368 [Cryptosporidium canis]|uniref:Uncharacterized protein n=1 Tax=Cryptosporidium canis TaxID=195482 RepID=A0A9D5HUP2_9CRYT|nr:hypothetical protein OJ253_3368 [Cryptosporidium canis]